MEESKSLKGKIALITGGSRDIGRAITLKLADQGADVIINYFRKRAPAEETAQEVRQKGVAAHIIKANIADSERIDSMFNEIQEKFGRLDILINNAASGVARSALDLEGKSWDWTMDVNAKAFLLCTQKAVAMMENGGRIVAISSLGSRLVMPTYTAVGVSKAALEALVRYLAIELAPKGIRVNGVAPGGVETMALRMYTAGQDVPQVTWKSTPAGRMVLPEDIANVVAFLCTDESEMVRGQIIVIDGGISLAPIG